MPEPIRIEIYSRPGCHLCDQARAVIEEFRGVYAMTIRTISVETSVDLENRYGTDIPVVFLNGEEAFRHRVDRGLLERKLKTLWNK